MDREKAGNTVLYWTESGGAIKSINTNGTEEKTILEVSGMPLDIALYMPGKKIYWTEYTGNYFKIKKSDLDGNDTELFYERYAFFGDHGPSAITIDHQNAIIYWNLFNDPNNDVWRAPLNTASKEKWISSISQSYIYSICLYRFNRKIYFTANSYWSSDFGTGNTGVAGFGDLSTAGITPTYPVNETGPVADSASLKGIAVDESKGYVYYVSNSNAGLYIIRSDLSLNNRVIWVSASGSGFSIKKIALDTIKRKIYWTSDAENDYRIYRADLDTPNSGIEQFLQLDYRATGITVEY